MNYIYKQEEKDDIESKVCKEIEINGPIDSVSFEDRTGVKMWKFTFYFGGLKKFHSSHGCTYRQRTRLTKEELMKDIQRVFDEHGYMKKILYEKEGKHSCISIKKHFGTFNKMLKEMGFHKNMNKSTDGISKEDIKNRMYELYKEYGYLNSTLQREKSGYSQIMIDKSFGGFNKMLDEMDLPKNKRPYTKDEILYNIKLLFYKYGFLSSTLIDKQCEFSYMTCTNKFGSLNNILSILHLENEMTQRESSGSKQIEFLLKNKYELFFEKEKSWEWLININTLHKLYVDFYIPSLNLCIEFNGKQHYEFFSHFHENISSFYQSKIRDCCKRGLLAGYGKNIETIRYDDDIELKLEEILKKYIK